MVQRTLSNMAKLRVRWKFTRILSDTVYCRGLMEYRINPIPTGGGGTFTPPPPRKVLITLELVQVSSSYLVTLKI